MRQSISFNNSEGFWLTRLSYVPSMMAWINQHHISSPQLNVNPFWIHDESATTNNSFYGDEPVSSAVSITFNDNPSENKIYKSFSIETPDINSISGVNTFTPNNGTKNSISKTVAITTLKQKGGIMYGGVPGIQERTVSSIEYLGTVVDTIPEGIDEFPDFGEYYILDGGGSGWTGQEALITNNPNTILDTPANQTIDAIFEGGVLASNSSFSIGDSLFIAYTNSNGDQARGQFADSTVVFGSGDFEIYSINVDYEPTDLDHNS